MKVRRQKHMKRVMKFYKNNFNIDTNFINIIVDGTFANEALKCKINLAEQLPNYFDLKPNKCNILTTKCALKETELLGKTTYGAMVILKQYKQVECRHKRDYINSEKCIKNLLIDSNEANSKAKYIIATQVKY
jgi:rRNA-processing protein FCF1